LEPLAQAQQFISFKKSSFGVTNWKKILVLMIDLFKQLTVEKF